LHYEELTKAQLITELMALRQKIEKLQTNKGIALSESQQQMEQVIELLPDATLVINMRGEVVFWNKAMQEMTGVPKEEIIGKGDYEYALPFYGYRRPILIDMVLMSEREYSEIEDKYDFIGQEESNLSGEVYVPNTYGGKGAYLWGYASLLYDRQGRVYGAIQSIRDISDRKQTEMALRHAEERFGKAFMVSPIPMAISEQKNGIYLDVNDSFLQATGYSRQEIIGASSLDLKIWVDASQRDEILHLLKNGEKVRNREIKYQTSHGQERLALLSMEAILINKTDCLVTMFLDITEHRQMEKDIARLDRLNLIGEMAASIGHEIRNPMTAVRGFIQLLNERERNPQDKAYFDIMLEELDRANEIISEYLRMARDKIVNLHPHSLDQVVRAIAPMLEADANYRGMTIELNLGNPPLALIDENEIRQLLLNMARNGMEAMTPGGILTIMTSSEGKEVILSIKDQGHGLPASMLEKLGTPFVTTKDEGTGLGLAVSYSVVARHNARIDYETGSDGTAFHIYFPLPD